jgi:hypothetical protein
MSHDKIPIASIKENQHRDLTPLIGSDYNEKPKQFHYDKFLKDRKAVTSLDMKIQEKRAASISSKSDHVPIATYEEQISCYSSMSELGGEDTDKKKEKEKPVESKMPVENKKPVESKKPA